MSLMWVMFFCSQPYLVPVAYACVTKTVQRNALVMRQCELAADVTFVVIARKQPFHQADSRHPARTQTG